MVSPATALLLQAAAWMSLSRATAINGLTKQLAHCGNQYRRCAISTCCCVVVALHESIIGQGRAGTISGKFFPVFFLFSFSKKNFFYSATHSPHTQVHRQDVLPERNDAPPGKRATGPACIPSPTTTTTTTCVCVCVCVCALQPGTCSLLFGSAATRTAGIEPAPSRHEPGDSTAGVAHTTATYTSVHAYGHRQDVRHPRKCSSGYPVPPHDVRPLAATKCVGPSDHDCPPWESVCV